MSTKKGPAKKSQKYHNKVAFELRFDQKKIEVNSNAPLDRLCARCMEQIRWKCQYGKYKPATCLSRCNKCQQKTINKAYRTVCDKCADHDRLCAKCGQAKDIVEPPKAEKRSKTGEVDKDKLAKMEDYLDGLRERSRRNIMRRLMKGEIEFEGGLFVDVDTKEPVKGLKFKGDADELEDNWEDGDDDDDFDDDDDMDDEDDEDEAPKGKGKGKEEEKVETKKEAKEEKEEEIQEIVSSKPEQKEQGKKNKAPAKPAGKKAQKKKQESEDDDDDDFDDDDDLDDF